MVIGDKLRSLSVAFLLSLVPGKHQTAIQLKEIHL